MGARGRDGTRSRPTCLSRLRGCPASAGGGAGSGSGPAYVPTSVDVRSDPRPSHHRGVSAETGGRGGSAQRCSSLQHKGVECVVFAHPRPGCGAGLDRQRKDQTKCSLNLSTVDSGDVTAHWQYASGITRALLAARRTRGSSTCEGHG